MSVFARPGISEDQVELIRFGASEPLAAVRVNKCNSEIISQELFRDFEIRFVYFNGNQPRLRVHSIEYPRCRHASARAEFEKLAGGFRRRKSTEQTPREQVGSHRAAPARGF